MSLPRPDPFLTVRVHNIDLKPSVSGLCAGYERGEWRAKQLCPSYEPRLPHIFRMCIMFGHEVLAVIRRPEPERFCFH